MFNPETGRVSVTRNIRWLDTMIGDDFGRPPRQSVAISGENGIDNGIDIVDSDADDDDIVDSDIDDDDGNNTRDDGDSTDNNESHTHSDDSNDDDEHKSVDDDDEIAPDDETNTDKNDVINNPKLQQELRCLHTCYNPTLHDIGDMALVGGTDDTYVNPPGFKEAWNHEDPQDRQKWRDGIIKEFRDMRTRKVWKIVNIKDIPPDRRLIGCRWVNKRKRNGVYRARLVALGYSQIPGVDYTDNFAPVIQDTTFRIICFMIVVNGWVAEIVDVETAFLYGDLEETIYI